MLVLLDIDGTLVRCGGSGRQALNHAFSEVCGVDAALEGVRLAGSTDRIIIEDACRAAGITLDDDQVTAVFDAYVTHLRALLEGDFPGYAVLPGARQIAEALDRSAAHVVGRATGNIESAARVKLAPAGLNEHLTFGGFGSDGRARTELLARGIERGQAASRRKGRQARQGAGRDGRTRGAARHSTRGAARRRRCVQLRGHHKTAKINQELTMTTRAQPPCAAHM